MCSHHGVALHRTKCHSGHTHRAFRSSTHDLLYAPELSLPCHMGNALIEPLYYSSDVLSGAFLVGQLGDISLAFFKGSHIVLKKVNDLALVSKLVESFLQFTTFSHGVVIRLVKLTIFTYIQPRGHRRWSFEHGVVLDLHKDAPGIHLKALIPASTSLPPFSLNLASFLSSSSAVPFTSPLHKSR